MTPCSPRNPSRMHSHQSGHSYNPEAQGHGEGVRLRTGVRLASGAGGGAGCMGSDGSWERKVLYDLLTFTEGLPWRHFTYTHYVIQQTLGDHCLCARPRAKG